MAARRTVISPGFTLPTDDAVMRLGNLGGRLVLHQAGSVLDVEQASGGRFAADPQLVYGRWAEFRDWAAQSTQAAAEPFDEQALEAPAPRPAQVFAIGLNYAEHASEAGFGRSEAAPPVFTKFPTCITGPFGEIRLPPGGHTDWEVELVVVIGLRAERVAAADAWAHVAGLTVGQDLSERISQLAGPAPQFGLAKSFPRFGPVGPWLVTVDEVPDPDDLELSCSINGETVQQGRTGRLLFDVPAIIEHLSAVVPLLPGDVIFTGTPPGVGMGRTPQRWLAPGDELVSRISGIGEMRHRFVAGEE